MAQAGFAEWKPKWALARAYLAGIGKAGRLAPGTLQPGEPFLADQFHLARLRREHGDIFKIWWSGKLTTCIVGHALGQRLLNENRDRLQVVTIDMRSAFPHGFIRGMEGDVHARYRRQLAAAFKATIIDDRPDVTEIITGFLAELASGDGRRSSRELATAAMKASTALMLLLIFGAGHRSEFSQRLTAAYNAYAPWGMPPVLGRRERDEFRKIRALIVEHARTFASTGGPDPATGLLEHLARHETLDDTILGNLIQMAEFGRFDLHGLWRWMLLKMAGYPHFMQLIASETDAVRRRRMCRAVVSETLRIQQSEFIYRTATETFIFDGVLIPRRSRIRICILEGHRDSQMFRDPDVFRPERFLETRFSSDVFAPLGIDHHRCLAAEWVMRLSSLLAEEAARSFTLGLAKCGTATKGHFHFEPDDDFELMVSRKP